MIVLMASSSRRGRRKATVRRRKISVARGPRGGESY
jgi:hypothetical protein